MPSGATYGLSWLDRESLVINQVSQLGSQNQLLRLSYPAGQLSRLTNDRNDYVGASQSGDGSGLVTARRDARMDIWIGDAAGAAGTGSGEHRAAPAFEGFTWSGDALNVRERSSVAGQPSFE